MSSSSTLQEGLRLHPVGNPMFSPCRMCVKDTEVGGYQVPAGVGIMLNSTGISRSPEYFPDPDVSIAQNSQLVSHHNQVYLQNCLNEGQLMKGSSLKVHFLEHEKSKGSLLGSVLVKEESVLIGSYRLTGLECASNEPPKVFLWKQSSP